jgi:putative two-component system response regulator
MTAVMTEKKKILLVDDDELQLTLAENILKNEYEVYKAHSGNEALQYLYNSHFVPDLILLDILMPHMDGWEAFNRIKAIGLLQNVPIIFLTGVTEGAEKKRALEIGAADYITKPINQGDLLKRLKEILEKNKPKDS